MDKLKDIVGRIGAKLKEIDDKIAKQDDKVDSIINDDVKKQFAEIEEKVANAVKKLNDYIAADGEDVIAYRKSAEQEDHKKAKDNAIDID